MKIQLTNLTAVVSILHKYLLSFTTSSNLILLSHNLESNMCASWCEGPNYLAGKWTKLTNQHLLLHRKTVLFLLLALGEASLGFCYTLLQRSSLIIYEVYYKESLNPNMYTTHFSIKEQ